MIKNLLYSLLLHMALILSVYFLFKFEKTDKRILDEISVSLVVLNNKTIEEQSIQKKEISEKEPLEEPKAEKPKNEQKKEIIPEKKPEKKNEEKKQKPKEIEEKPKESIPVKKGELELTEEKSLNQEKKNAAETLEKVENFENLDLSAREKFNIQSQLKSCYRRAVQESKQKNKIKIIIKISIEKTGNLNSNINNLIDLERYQNPDEKDYKISVDNVRRTIEICNPLRNLPTDKYQIWKGAMLEFNGDEIR